MINFLFKIYEKRIKFAISSAITQYHIVDWETRDKIVELAWDNLIMGELAAFKKRHPGITDEDLANL